MSSKKLLRVGVSKIKLASTLSRNVLFESFDVSKQNILERFFFFGNDILVKIILLKQRCRE